MTGTPGTGGAVLEEMAALAARLRRSTVQVLGSLANPSRGSGIVWRPGLIVTNAHVVSERALRIALADDDVRDARLAAIQPRRDLAVLQADTSGLIPATTASVHCLRVGDLVLAVGSPLGVTGAVSAGIVHAVAAPRRGPRLVLADVRLLPGNSGGPLADAQGRVVGVNAMIIGGLAAAIPSDAVERFLMSASRAA